METIQSKCGQVKVVLSQTGTTVEMLVLEMPEELRGRGDLLEHDGMRLRSEGWPYLADKTVHLRGRLSDDDGCVARLDDTDNTGYYYRVAHLIRAFDSTAVDWKLPWRGAGAFLMDRVDHKIGTLCCQDAVRDFIIESVNMRQKGGKE